MNAVLYDSMNLITFGEPITVAFRKSAGAITVTFEAGREYLLSNAQINRLMEDKNVQQKYYKLSKVEMRVPNFNVRAVKKGERVLLYNGSGGYGDQIMTWPVARILAGYGLDVHVLSDPGNNMCWWNFPWVKTVQTVPLLWEQAKLFNHLCLFEAVINLDEHQDQMHPIDVMLNKIGIDPATIPDKDKVVRPVFTHSELGALQGFLGTGRKIGLYQLSSANPVRCLPPSDSAFLLSKIAEATPDIHWLALYDEFVPKDYSEMLHCKVCNGTGTVGDKESKAPGASKKCSECDGAKYFAKNVEPFCAPNLRELWALTERVNIVVSPDSMMAHIAGSFGTPCVGLWGPVSPEKRMKYYANHFPIYHKEFCPHFPCFVYSANFPKYCPPRPAKRTTCDVIAAVSPAEVVEAINKIKR